MTKYAIVGPGTTPDHYNLLIERMASVFEDEGYNLSTRGRTGFEESALRGIDLSHNKTIVPGSSESKKPCRACFNIAWDMVGPKWMRYSSNQKLEAAYIVQTILGNKLNKPVKFLITYTEDEETLDEIYLSIRVARDHGILVFDLAHLSFQKIWTEVCSMK